MSTAPTLAELLPDKTPEERNAIVEALWADTEGDDDDDI